MIIVGKTCCKIAPRTLKTSPANHKTTNNKDKPSEDFLTYFDGVSLKSQRDHHIYTYIFIYLGNKHNNPKTYRYRP